jgi:hypothetical protein
MNRVEALVGIRMQNTGLRNPPVQRMRQTNRIIEEKWIAV